MLARRQMIQSIKFRITNMGLFDFIFSSKKKEQERLRLEEEERRQRLEQERIAHEREHSLEENRRKERERQERLKAEREQAASVQPFTFQSNCHQRYENGSPVRGLQDCLRTVSVVKNTNGCPGYRLQPGIGYIVKIYNDDLGKPNMSEKPMKVVRKTADMLELRGFPIEAQSPFGWQEVDYSDYGFIVYYRNGQIDKCVLHMYDRNIRIEYMKKESTPTASLHDLVHKCLNLETKGNIQELQNSLYALYSCFNKQGGGTLITNYPEKDNLALCFAFMLQYDWMHDSDLREVFAENGFYCIVDHIMHQSRGRQGQAEAMIILFTLLCAGRNSLIPKIQDILNKGKIVGNQIFHQDDYRIGAKNVIDQITLMAVSGTRDFGPAGAPIVSEICEKFNGFELFKNTISRKDLMKYDPMDVFQKMTFIHDVIESILNEM